MSKQKKNKSDKLTKLKEKSAKAGRVLDIAEPKKRGRGRPPKDASAETSATKAKNSEPTIVELFAKVKEIEKRLSSIEKSIKSVAEDSDAKPVEKKRGRGRPPKVAAPVVDDEDDDEEDDEDDAEEDDDDAADEDDDDAEEDEDDDDDDDDEDDEDGPQPDPKPFAAKFLKAAKEILAEDGDTAKSFKLSKDHVTVVKDVIEASGKDSPARTQLEALLKDKKKSAFKMWQHYVALRIADFADVEDAVTIEEGVPYIHNGFVYVSGVQIKKAPEGNYKVANKKPEIFNLTDGGVTKAKTAPEFDSVGFAPYDETYWAVVSDSEVVEVKRLKK